MTFARSYLNSHSQYGAPMAMHRVSFTCWFVTAEKKPLKKPVVKKQDGSFTLVVNNFVCALSQFSFILIISPIETFPTLQCSKRWRMCFTASSSLIPAFIRCSPTSFPDLAPPIRNAIRYLSPAMAGKPMACMTGWM